jgi:hypothetical protein
MMIERWGREEKLFERYLGGMTAILCEIIYASFMRIKPRIGVLAWLH